MMTTDGPQASVSPRTAADQSQVDDEVDEYLAHVGVPPRPRNRRRCRCLRLPSAATHEQLFWRQLNSGVERLAPDAPAPAEVSRALRQVLAELYA